MMSEEFTFGSDQTFLTAVDTLRNARVVFVSMRSTRTVTVVWDSVELHSEEAFLRRTLAALIRG